MSTGEVSKTWFEKYPKLYEKQSDILKSCGFKLNQEAFSKNRQIVFAGHSKVDPDRQLIVAFPQAFPSCAPKIFDTPSSKLLTRHHRNDTRQLCLFSFSESNWNASLSVADALAEAENLISKFKAGSAMLERQPPEPLTRAVTYKPNAAMLVPPPISTFKDFSKLKFLVGRFSGKFIYDGDFKRDTRGRGAILEATFGAEKMRCSRQYSNYLGSNGKEIQGDWFYLQNSPTQENLHEVIKKCFQKIHGVKKAQYYWLGLIFNEEAGGDGQSRLTWLIVRASAAGEFHLIRTFPYIENERYVRIPGLEGLEKKRVTIVGCGSLGSKIAVNLAASGVNRFHLVDCDYFEPNNSVRHELGVECFGLNKEHALLIGRLCSLNPAVAENSSSYNFQVGGINPFDREQQFYKLVEESDLVIDTTAIHSVSRFLNELSFELRIPTLFATVTNGAWGGEIVRSIPGKTPCWLCWLDQYYENNPPSAPESTSEIFAPGCDQPTFTGTTYELGMVANLATSMAVDTLLASKDFSKNYIRWSGKDKTGQPIFLTEILPTSHQKECYLCGSQYGI
jgi:molybdopterin/thiamine biosynthesis adenylyltransferase